MSRRATGDFQARALALFHAGYRVVPIPLGDKGPHLDGWLDLPDNQTEANLVELIEEVGRRWPSAGVGIFGKNAPGADIDVRVADVVQQLSGLAQGMLGPSFERIGQPPKLLLPYRTETPFDKITSREFSFPGEDVTAEGFKYHKVEFLGQKQQWVAFHIHPDTKRPYRWLDDLPGREDLTEITEEQARAFRDAAETMIIAAGGRPRERQAAPRGNGEAKPSRHGLAGTVEAVAEALKLIPNADVSYDDWRDTGMAIKGALGDTAEAWGLFDGWSQLSRKYATKETEKLWRGAKPTQLGAGAIYGMARAHGWKPDPSIALNPEKAKKREGKLIGNHWEHGDPRPDHPARKRKDAAEPNGEAPEVLRAMGGSTSSLTRYSSEAERERVDLTPHRINVAARQCAALLRDVIYMRGPVPSALLQAEEVRGDEVDAVDAKPEPEPGVMLGGVRHAKGSLILAPPASGLVQYQLDERAAFWRFDKRADDWVPTSCPKDLVTRLIDAATELGYRSCSAIVPLPMFIAGRIIAEPGYHSPTGRIIAFNGKLPPIPERPTKAEALAALDVLIRPFRGYLRADDTGAPLRVATAAAVLTAVLRPSLPAAPAINVDANISGAGKGKYGRVLSVITTGSLPALVTEGHNHEEFDKRISAAILSGAPAILLDNLQRPLEASALESILTEATATIRLFGQLGGVTVPFRSLVVITANNTVLRRDMLRRILPVRIVVDTDEPEARRFDFDPYTEAKRDRMAILAAGFTIIRAWWHGRETDEGRRIRATTLGSFEQWADLVAGAVEWLTGINPVTLIEERKAADPKRGDERQIIAALHAYFPRATWTAKEAIGRPAQRDFSSGDELPATGIVPALWTGVMKFKGDRPAPVEVGKWLAKHRDTPFPGFILTGKPDRDGVMHWQVHATR